MFRKQTTVRFILVFTLLVFSMMSISAASVLPAQARGRKTITVMTRNIYFGADITPLLFAPDFEALKAAVTQAYLDALATNFPERAEALASEIAKTRPVLIGLQEGTVWQTVPAGSAETVDFVQLILAALERRGLHYVPVAVAPGLDAVAPTNLGFEVRLTISDMILAPADPSSLGMRITNVETGRYITNLTVPTPIGPVTIPRQWALVDARIRGRDFRFITTHLEAASPFHRIAQGFELLVGPANTSLPTVLVGDLNSEPNQTGDAAHNLIAAGFVDVWSQKNPSDPGYTCCQAPDLRNDQSLLSKRIDLILTRGRFKVQDLMVVGDEPGDKTPSGQWPSDHGGVVGTLRVR